MLGGTDTPMKEDDALTPTANSTAPRKAVNSRALVPSSSRKGSELTIEALYSIRTTRSGEGCRGDDEIPDEGERARLISDITRLIREPHMPEPTRCAGLTRNNAIRPGRSFACASYRRANASTHPAAGRRYCTFVCGWPPHHAGSVSPT